MCKPSIALVKVMKASTNQTCLVGDPLQQPGVYHTVNVVLASESANKEHHRSQGSAVKGNSCVTTMATEWPIMWSVNTL